MPLVHIIVRPETPDEPDLLAGNELNVFIVRDIGGEVVMTTPARQVAGHLTHWKRWKYPTKSGRAAVIFTWAGNGSAAAKSDNNHHSG